eukprot:4359323-Amphidinium_carterae.1
MIRKRPYLDFRNKDSGPNEQCGVREDSIFSMHLFWLVWQQRAYLGAHTKHQMSHFVGGTNESPGLVQRLTHLKDKCICSLLWLNRQTTSTCAKTTPTSSDVPLHRDQKSCQKRSRPDNQQHHRLHKTRHVVSEVGTKNCTTATVPKVLQKKKAKELE